MVYLLIFISFTLESIVSRLINYEHALIPLFTLTSFVILYPHFKTKFNYIITIIVCGLIYDIAQNTFFINTICFGICGGFIITSYNYVKYNVYTASIINLINICLYRVISYILLVVVEYLRFNFSNLLEGIYKSLIFNLIYGIVFYLVTKLIYKIVNKKKNGI